MGRDDVLASPTPRRAARRSREGSGGSAQPQILQHSLDSDGGLKMDQKPAELMPVTDGDDGLHVHFFLLQRRSRIAHPNDDEHCLLGLPQPLLHTEMPFELSLAAQRQ